MNIKIFRKIDKSLFDVLALDNSKIQIECLMFVNNFLEAKKFLNWNNIKIKGEFPFIKTFCLEINKDKLFSLCREKNVLYISKQSKVTSLMNVSKKVLGIGNKYYGNGITICYIDTGIYPHLDFTLSKNRILKFIDLIGDKRTPYDDNGHGTFVSGVGSGNGYASNGKYSGIAPHSNIISIKALNKDGEANAVKILEAMQWVYDNHKKYKIKSVCMSFGSEPIGYNDPIMKGAEELWKCGIVVVAAAGNSGPEFETIKSPGISSRIITVGALNDNRIENDFDKRFFEIASFSSRGPAFRRYKPDLVAPAVEICSCSNLKKEFYKKLSGTSVAAPMIAGITALMFEKEPNITPETLKQQLLAICRPITYNRNIEGFGLPNMLKILN